MAISAALVRELRERSGAGMMECKKALEATGGDVEQAIDHLRKSGLKTAAKKAGREMSEGRVFAELAADGHVGAMIAVTCETDFVAKTPNFQEMLSGLSQHALAHKPADTQAMLAQAYEPTGASVEESVKLVVGKLGENIQLARVSTFQNPEGYVCKYIHHNHKVGVLASVTTGAPREKAEAEIKELCMHIAFSDPAGLNRDDIPAEEIERERAIYLDEVKSKPAEIQQKIVDGKLNSFFAGRVLVEQPWIKDDKIKVQAYLEQALGSGTRVEGFQRYRIGS